MRIGIDMDGVIVDTINYVASELSHYLNREVKPDEVAHNLGKIDNIGQIFEEHGERLLCSLDPFELAADSINSIVREHDVYIISARFHVHYESTLQWLKKHGINVDKVIFTEGKGKSDICIENGIDVFIEDSAKNALELADHGIKVILYSTEYNASIQRENIIRCDDWPCILEAIKRELLCAPGQSWQK
ncbi:MAG: hypothetical protein GX279_07855 [Clostridiaceae bacterium]|nr:hypothetical protein [Clostridiaceae bacterium]